jgi:endo-alpha-1,4-polygalactosaminidase (GH114 family)
MFRPPFPAAVMLSAVLALTGAATAWHAPPRLAPADLVSQVQASTNGGEAERRHRMATIRNWGSWLSSVDLDSVADAPHDLLVMDNGISAGGRFQRERKPEEIARMKKRADGRPRVLL